MKIREFPILADQNIHADVNAFLRTEGFDVVDVEQAGLTSASDTAILQFAQSEGRIVLTHDADFGTLTVSSGMQFVGIVYLRPGHVGPLPTIDSIQQLLAADPQLRPPFIVVVKRSQANVMIRIRQPIP